MRAGPDANKTDLDALAKLNADYIKAVEASDVSWFDANLAEGFLNSNPDGTLVDRDGFLARIAKPAGISNFAAEDVRIRIMGELAIVHGRTSYIKADGSPGAGRYTDVWARLKERWQCVAAHITRG